MIMMRKDECENIFWNVHSILRISHLCMSDNVDHIFSMKWKKNVHHFSDFDCKCKSFWWKCWGKIHSVSKMLKSWWISWFENFRVRFWSSLISFSCYHCQWKIMFTWRKVKMAHNFMMNQFVQCSSFVSLFEQFELGISWLWMIRIICLTLIVYENQLDFNNWYLFG